MTRITNPVILRLGSTSGWHQTYFTPIKNAHTESFNLWLKLYIFIKAYLKKKKILIINFEFKTNNRDVLLLYLNVQLPVKKPWTLKVKTRFKSKKLKRYFRLVAKTAYLNRIYTQIFRQIKSKPKKKWILAKLKRSQVFIFNQAFLSNFKKKAKLNNQNVFAAKQMRNIWFKKKISCSKHRLKHNFKLKFFQKYKIKYHKTKNTDFKKVLRQNQAVKKNERKTLNFKNKVRKKNYNNVKFRTRKNNYLRFSKFRNPPNPYNFFLKKKYINIKFLRSKITWRLRIQKQFRHLDITLIKILARSLNNNLSDEIITTFKKIKKISKNERAIGRSLAYQKKVTQKDKIKYIFKNKIPVWTKYFTWEQYLHSFFKQCFNLTIIVKFHQNLEKLILVGDVFKKLLTVGYGEISKFKKIKKFNKIVRSMFTYYQFGHIFMIGENVAKLLERNKKRHTWPLDFMGQIIRAYRPHYWHGYNLSVFGKINARTRTRILRIQEKRATPLKQFDTRVDSINTIACAKTGSFGIYFTTFMGWSRL